MSLKYSGSHPSRERAGLQLRFWAIASLEVRPRNLSEEETFSKPALSRGYPFKGE